MRPPMLASVLVALQPMILMADGKGGLLSSHYENALILEVTGSRVSAGGDINGGGEFGGRLAPHRSILSDST